MADPLQRLFAAAGDWVEEAIAAGWLDESARARLAAVERATPADLFGRGQARPLVVALFGGTGVGKSSLLNRLAGEAIAATGVERPTSHEVTCYLHADVALEELPAELPVEKVRVRRHAHEGWRGVCWVDMPDIDSTERANRELALAWLPHVDLLLYVVSPERYRDDAGWQVLRARGGRHGWMFVMNHWDEGDTAQAEDFTRLLGEAGFDDPLVLRTSCAPGADAAGGPPLPSPDEFDEIARRIQELLAAHGVRELERLGHRARLRDLAGVLEALAGPLGDDARWREAREAWDGIWRSAREAIGAGTEFPIDAIAAQFAAREGGAVASLVRTGVRVAAAARYYERAGGERLPDGVGGARAEAVEAEAGGAAAQRLLQFAEQVWDAWATEKLRDAADALEVRLRRAALAEGPLRSEFEAVIEQADRQVRRATTDTLRVALARPGGRVGRVARRVLGWLTVALPLAALGLVGWNVVTSYVAFTRGSGALPGVEFAVHSVLVVLIAWLAPFLLDRLVRPSLERVTARALREGLAAGLDSLEAAFERAWSAVARQRDALLDRRRALMQEIEAFSGAAPAAGGSAARLVAGGGKV